MIITLRAKNPQMTNDMVRFSHVEGRFVPVKLKEMVEVEVAEEEEETVGGAEGEGETSSISILRYQ